MTTALYVGVFIVGYLLGSIPFGLLLTRLAGLGDIRQVGSGNIGATNVLRTGRRDVAALTLLLDALKGAAGVLVGWAIAQELGIAGGFGAFIGHLFPVWLGFRGGKGVATYVGALAALAWPIALAFGIIWGACAAITRYSSASALVATLATPVLLFFFADHVMAYVFAIMTAIVWWKHSANISRLRSGTETRIGATR